MVRVLISAEDRLWIDAVSVILDQHDGLTIVGKMVDAERAVYAAGSSDVVVVHHDIREPGAVDILRRINEDFPDVKTVVVGVPDSAPVQIEYFEAGAIGYVRANDPLDRLVDVIIEAHAGETTVDPETAAALIERLSSLRTMVDDITPNLPDNVDLTPREHEVLQLIADGKTNQDISDELFIEVGTVKNHVHSILQKLNVNDRHQAAFYVNMHSEAPDPEANIKHRGANLSDNC